MSGHGMAGTGLDAMLLRRRVRALLAPWAGGRTPGMTVGVVRGGALALHESAGLASLELNVPIGPGTCFRIASVSKQFTCAAVLMLAAEGRLDVDEPAQRHLPELAGVESVSIAQLMHNSSGVRDMLEIMRQGGVDLGQKVVADDLLAGIRRQRTLNFAPNGRFLYSNSNFLLLGLLVERISGEALGAFLHRRIFAPLGMTATRLADDPRGVEPELATGYLPRDGWFMRAPHAFPLGGEGGLVSSVEDLALWARNYDTGRVGGLALVRALEQQAPFSNGTANLYARGLRIGEHRGVRTVSHGGLWPGYKTEFLRVPELDAAVICISNHGGSDPNTLAHQVLDVLIDEARPGTPAVPPLPPRAALEPLAGRWVDADGGATLDIALDDGGAPVVAAGGVPLRPEPAADGRLATLRGTVQLALRPLGAERIEVEQDAGYVSTWHRAGARAALPDGLAGEYTSEEMAATWRFEATRGGAAEVAVEGPLLRGVRWEVEAVEGDLFRVWLPSLLFRGWLDVRATRDGGGRIDGLLVNSNRLKNVRYRRTA